MIYGSFSYKEFCSEAKERAPSNFQLQPVIITHNHNSSVLHLAIILLYPNATLNKQYFMSLLDKAMRNIKYIYIYSSFSSQCHNEYLPC